MSVLLGDGGGWVCPQAQVNKFEQDYSDDHKMSLARVGYLRSNVWGRNIQKTCILVAKGRDVQLVYD